VKARPWKNCANSLRGWGEKSPRKADFARVALGCPILLFKIALAQRLVS
jgi:hypothetical protein